MVKLSDMKPSVTEKYKHIFVAYSGGKDSTASYIKARERFGNNLELVFNDTGDEMPETYDYIRYINAEVHPVVRLAQKLESVSESGRRKFSLDIVPWEMSLEEMKEAGYNNIFDEIRRRYEVDPERPMWPGNGLRYCTTALKVNPFFRYIRTKVPVEDRPSVLVVRGLRREESSGRSNIEEYDFVSNGRDGYVSWHPIYDLSTEEVFDLHREHGIKINPVYGIRLRSNCIGCPFASNAEIQNTIKVYPNSLDLYVQIEEETGWTWKPNISLKDVVSGKELPDTDKFEERLCLSGFCDI